MDHLRNGSIVFNVADPLSADMTFSFARARTLEKAEKNSGRYIAKKKKGELRTKMVFNC